MYAATNQLAEQQQQETEGWAGDGSPDELMDCDAGAKRLHNGVYGGKTQ